MKLLSQCAVVFSKKSYVRCLYVSDAILRDEYALTYGDRKEEKVRICWLRAGTGEETHANELHTYHEALKFCYQSLRDARKRRQWYLIEEIEEI